MKKGRIPLRPFFYATGPFVTVFWRKEALPAGRNGNCMKLKKFGNTEAVVYDLVMPIAEEHGLIVWDVRFEKEGACWYLRVLLDHMERAVTIQDCENVTRPLNKLLDEQDPIAQSYTLEVGSAGVERELLRETHFDACEGCAVSVRLIRPDDKGRRDIAGMLISCDREAVTVETDGNAETYPLAGVAYVRLADFDFNADVAADAPEGADEN